MTCWILLGKLGRTHKVTYSYGLQSAKTYIYQLRADIGYRLEDWVRKLADKDGWRESQRNPYCQHTKMMMIFWSWRKEKLRIQNLRNGLKRIWGMVHHSSVISSFRKYWAGFTQVFITINKIIFVKSQAILFLNWRNHCGLVTKVLDYGLQVREFEF